MNRVSQNFAESLCELMLRQASAQGCTQRAFHGAKEALSGPTPAVTFGQAFVHVGAPKTAHLPVGPIDSRRNPTGDIGLFPAPDMDPFSVITSIGIQGLDPQALRGLFQKRPHFDFVPAR